MTEAQKAHLRLLANTPAEKIRTHLCADAPAVSERQQFIRDHVKTMTQKEIARELGISQGSVSWQIRTMKLKGRGRGRPKTKGRHGRQHRNG